MLYHGATPSRGAGHDWSASGAAPLAAGRVAPAIAGYRMTRHIGQGRRSSVWLARDLQHGGDVALKIASCRPGAAVSFEREYELALRLPHPRIVRPLEQGSAAGVAYLAMEYLAGGNLARRTAHPLAAAEAVACLRQAAQALQQLHDRGLVHRDVKPANFLLRADGSLALADFGLVAESGSAHDLPAGSIVGTPRYISPEQLQGGPARPAADVYSLGVLFHELLCGRPPFAGETLMEVLSQHLVASAPPLPGALAPLQGLAGAMLAKEVDRRLPDAAAVLEQIESLNRAAILRPAPAGRPARGGTS
jgi:serine/threonine protein kinase